MAGVHHLLGQGVLSSANNVVGPWWTGPWPAPYASVPAIDAANVVAAYQPKWATGTIYARTDAADYANSKINLANPGVYDATDGTDVPTWTENSGWNFEVPAKPYLDTGYVPVSTDGMFVQVAESLNFATVSGDICGCNSGGDTMFMLQQPSGQMLYGDGGYKYSSFSMYDGSVGVYRQGGYRNGVLDETITTPFSAQPTRSVWVGVINQSSLGNSVVLISSFIIVSQITTTQIEALAYAMKVIGDA